MKIIVSIAGVLSLAICNSGAAAQDWNAAPRERPRQDEDHVILGMGAVVAPAYQGADDYRTLPLPMVDVAVGPFFANLRNGVGINAVEASGLTIGGSVAFMPGYRRRDVPQGVERLKAGAGARLFANVTAGGAIITVGATRGVVGSTKGFVADASVSYPIAASPRFMLIPTVGTSWANARHNDRYFGIDAGESAASGLSEFRGEAGFKDVAASLTANYRLTNRLNLSASGGVSTLLGKVKDSPLVERSTQPFGFVSLSYRFGR